MWNKKEMSQLDATLIRVPLTLTLNFQGQIVSREWEAWLSWNKRDGSWQDAPMWNATTTVKPLTSGPLVAGHPV